MNHTLYLASKSAPRKLLLTEAGIPFEVIGQEADESVCDWGLPLQQLVESIAVHKMEHAVLPPGDEGKTIFVLTADTLSLDSEGTIHGKPVDEADARNKIKALRKGGTCGTGFCLDKKVYRDGAWHTADRIVRFVSAQHVFDVPDHWLDEYIKSGQGNGASGGIRIEGFGSQFLKSIDGSYTAIVGLPMYELRCALDTLGFFL